MNKKNVYNKIRESISNEVKKTLNETENTDMHIKKIYLYPWDNIKDKEFLNMNKKQIWEFFDNGYKAANLDGFNKSCTVCILNTSFFVYPHTIGWIQNMFLDAMPFS